MKLTLSLLILTLFFSCTKKEEEILPYLIQYKSQIVTPEGFLKKLVIQSYIKYKEQRSEKLKNSANLEALKKETLALLIQEIFVNDLANNNSIIIKDDELKKWISSRSEGTRSENLNLFLNTNGLKMSDWNRMFKNQLLLHKVKEFLNTSKGLEMEEEKKNKANKVTQVQIGVISYDEKHEAETAYTRIRRGKTNFTKLLKVKTGSEKFQWLPEDSLPFKDKIKNLRLKRVSKVLQTDWGHSLIFINKREKKPINNAQNKSNSIDSKWSSALKDFKESVELKINFDLFYGLKLKR